MPRHKPRALALLIPFAAAACATSGSRSLLDRSTFGSWIKIDAAGARVVSDRAGVGPPVNEVGQFGAAARAFAGPTIGWVGGIDAHLGASLPAGALYDFNLSPLGVGLYGHGVLVGALGGVGVGGIIGRVPVAFQLPVEALLDVDLGLHVHFGAWANVRWVVGAAARDDGAAHAPFGDELSTGAMLRIGRGDDGGNLRWGNGPFVAGTYAEALGAHAWGAQLGYSITLAGRQ
jgi:hypothetical protein